MNAEENPGYYLPEEDDMAIAGNTSVYACLDSEFPLGGSPEDRPVLVDGSDRGQFQICLRTFGII